MGIERINIKTHTQYRKSKSKIAPASSSLSYSCRYIFEHSTLKGTLKELKKNNTHTATHRTIAIYTEPKATYTELRLPTPAQPRTFKLSSNFSFNFLSNSKNFETNEN